MIELQERVAIMLTRNLKVIFLNVLLTAALTECVAAQTRVPQFKDYAVRERFAGRNARPVIRGEAREFRTRLREASRSKPNFAGHYIIGTWGCGTECLMGGIIDAKTGRVYSIPFSVCCWGFDVDENFKPLEFRLDSKLIVITGARNEEGNGTYFYKFENNRLTLLRAIEKKPQPQVGRVNLK
jgi:hypothetical protein